MRKIKICFFCGYFPILSGGSEYQTYLLSKYLDKNEFDIFFLSWDLNRDGLQFIDNTKIYFFKPHGFLSKYDYEYISSYSYFKNIFDKEKPDFVFQMMSNAATGLLFFLSRKYGFKFIWVCASDSDFWKFKYVSIGSLLRIPEYLLKRYGMQNADLALTQTQYQKKMYEHIFKRPAHILPNLHYIPTGFLSKNTNTIIVLWLANFKRLKQPEIFIDLAIHLKHLKSVKFIMIGRPANNLWQRNIENRLKMMSNIDYIGGVTQEVANEYLANSHILVNTSLYEGFSNTFIQAWLRKVPVVSLNSDPDKLLSEKGLGFCSFSFENLVNDVKRLICDKNLREEIGDKAFQYASINHSVSKIGSQFVEIIKKNYINQN